MYDFDIGKATIYAFLDVSNYNLIIQENQELVISRIDNISTDLEFYSPSTQITFPIHLTMNGINDIDGMNYDVVFSKLYSIGTGTLYNHINNEILLEDLDIKRTGTGIIEIENAKDYSIYPSDDLYPADDVFPGRTTDGLKQLEIQEKEEGLYPSNDLYPADNLYPQNATDKWIIYKFKLYRQYFEGEKEKIKDTGLYYYQSQKTDLTNKLKLEIKYERS